MLDYSVEEVARARTFLRAEERGVRRGELVDRDDQVVGGALVHGEVQVKLVDRLKVRQDLFPFA